MSVEAIDAALWVENCGRCEPPYDRQHIRKIAESATAWEPNRECPASDLLCQPHTDTGNAERLVALYGRDIRFCSETKKWSVWDGRRWNSEDTRRVKMLAKRTMRQMYVQTTGIKDANMKKAAEKHARKSDSSAGIDSMLACAEYEGSIPVSASDFDQNKYLLNLLDGTLDLSTGRMHQHRREDLISKLVHFKFNPKAECPYFSPIS